MILVENGTYLKWISTINIKPMNRLFRKRMISINNNMILMKFHLYNFLKKLVKMKIQDHKIMKIPSKIKNNFYLFLCFKNLY